MKTVYRITLPLEKAYRDGRWIIRGVAAGTGVDQQGQRIEPSAIEGLVRQINNTPVPFRDWHAKESVLGEEMGYVTKAWVEPDFSMGVEVELDQEHPTARYVWDKIGQGKKYGMSVGGSANEFEYVYDTSVNRNVLSLKSISIDEVSITTRPAYTPSFGTVVRKAIDEASARSAEGDASVGDENTPEAEVENVLVDATQPDGVDVVVEDVAEADPAPAPGTPVESTVDVEKAISADTARDGKKLSKIVRLYREQGELLRELGLLDEQSDDDNEANLTAATETVVEKSEGSSETEDDRIIRLEKALEDYRSQMELLRAQIPATVIPPVLVRKTAEEELAEEISQMTPRERLRFGLAAMPREGRR